MTKLTMIAAAVALTASAAGSAHVTVWPKESSAAAHERYAIRVPNEKTVDTVEVDVSFPEGLRVTAVEQKPDWMAEAVRDASGKLVGVHWHGRLPPQEFTEFGLLGVNPSNPGALRWSAVQIFTDGSKIDWSGPAKSSAPGSITTVR